MRLVLDKLSENLKQPVVLENRPGAGSTLGTDQAAKAYGVPVILNTDHCAKKLLPWIDGLLTASEEQFAKTGKPLYSSHMLDLSEEPLHENVEVCCQYLKRMAKMGMTLEIDFSMSMAG